MMVSKATEPEMSMDIKIKLRVKIKKKTPKVYEKDE